MLQDSHPPDAAAGAMSGDLSIADYRGVMEYDSIRNFGGIDADADLLLDTCFQDHPAYISAMAHERFVIVGRKGSGKTAIYKRLIKQRQFNTFTYGHTFDDYPWPYHNAQAQAGVPEERRFLNSWRYLILMALSKLVLNDQSQPWHEDAVDSLNLVESFVVDSYGSRDPDLTQVFVPSRKLRFKAGFHLPFVGADGESVPVSELPQHFQEVNKVMTSAVIESLNADFDYYVCFDQLDLGFSRTDPVYSQQLIGLLLAAREVNLRAREAGRKASVVVFLRDDIYQLLEFEDKNKLTENHLSFVQWHRDETEFTLRRLMERRFAEVWGTETSWDDVFDDQDMTGRQSKYAHIVDRTYLRPRDMIKFCNEILEAHGSAAGKFSNADLIAARTKYSTYLRQELVDEIHKHIPNYQEYFQVLINIRDLRFSRADFDEAWRSRPSLTDTDPTDGLRELFEFSVVGYRRAGGGGGGSKYIFRYLDPTALFDETADGFQVHAGFKEAFDLTVRRRDRSDESDGGSDSGGAEAIADSPPT